MRNRLLLALVGVVALVLAIHDVPLASHLAGVERDRLVTGLERDAFIIAGRTEEALEEGVTSEQAEEIDRLIGDYALSENVRVVVVDAAGRAVFESDEDADPDADFLNRPEIRTALGGRPATGERESRTLGEELFYVAVPVLTGDRTIGAVRLSAPERVVSDEVAAQVRRLFVVAALSLLIAVGVAVAIAVTLTRPIAQLRRTTGELAAGDLGARADEHDGPPEVRQLAASVNTMAARLETLVERQRAFAGDASHQLRTPLTALRLRLEHLASAAQSGEVDPEGVVTGLGDAIDETDRLHRMIEGLLELTRAEDAAVGPGPVDAALVARGRVDHWSPLAEERGVELIAVAPATAPAAAVPGALEQMVDNLIDNALDASPRGSTITVEVETGGDVVEVHVRDEGAGMSADERSRAFERFWRGDGAVQGGSGLGLAIVDQLARASGGSSELREATGGGIDAVVTLPARAVRAP